MILYDNLWWYMIIYEHSMSIIGAYIYIHMYIYMTNMMLYMYDNIYIYLQMIVKDYDKIIVEDKALLTPLLPQRGILGLLSGQGIGPRAKHGFHREFSWDFHGINGSLVKKTKKHSKGDSWDILDSCYMYH